MSLALDLTNVRPAFAEPTRDSQMVFRQVMDAMARPGSIVDLSFAPDAPDGLHRAAGAVALTLFDFETPVWLDPALRAGDAEAWMRFHCGCPLTDAPRAAAFALIADAARAPELSAFNLGDAKYPDRSTTVLFQVSALTGGPPATLSGPGVKGETVVAPQGLPPSFWNQLIANNARFQFGVDVLLVAYGVLMALPRSSRIQFEGA
jgi:alpha-D-ribose 1-methylphosphonate 5-triphosphate synthase subunit PhnH